jgi:hypothetical protein
MHGCAMVRYGSLATYRDIEAAYHITRPITGSTFDVLRLKLGILVTVRSGNISILRVANRLGAMPSTK